VVLLEKHKGSREENPDRLEKTRKEPGEEGQRLKGKGIG